MTDQEDKFKKPPDEERLKVFRNLPAEVIAKLTKEEIKAFLYDDEWPDSLGEKLKDYLTQNP